MAIVKRRSRRGIGWIRFTLPKTFSVERNWNKISNNDSPRHCTGCRFGRLQVAARASIGLERGGRLLCAALPLRWKRRVKPARFRRRVGCSSLTVTSLDDSELILVNGEQHNHLVFCEYDLRRDACAQMSFGGLSCDGVEW